jgi:hypothetical protein
VNDCVRGFLDADFRCWDLAYEAVSLNVRFAPEAVIRALAKVYYRVAA